MTELLAFDLINCDVEISDVADCVIDLLDFNDNEVIVGWDVLDVNVLVVVLDLKDNAAADVDVALRHIKREAYQNWLTILVFASHQ